MTPQHRTAANHFFPLFDSMQSQHGTLVLLLPKDKKYDKSAEVLLGSCSLQTDLQLLHPLQRLGNKRKGITGMDDKTERVQGLKDK